MFLLNTGLSTREFLWFQHYSAEKDKGVKICLVKPGLIRFRTRGDERQNGKEMETKTGAKRAGDAFSYEGRKTIKRRSTCKLLMYIYEHVRHGQCHTECSSTDAFLFIILPPSRAVVCGC